MLTIDCSGETAEAKEPAQNMPVCNMDITIVYTKATKGEVETCRHVISVEERAISKTESEI